MRPVIAMPQMGTSLFRQYMKGKYVDALTQAGAEVRWVELDDPAQAVREALRCDGLLLPGGPDLAPSLYGQERAPASGEPNPLRDAAEPQLFRAFLQAGKPVFGICRGMQMINVCLGGSLLQDISGLQRCDHRARRSPAKPCHGCTVREDSRLFAILGAGEIPVNSLHHQVVDRIGDGLLVSAVSEDGFVEGVELPGPSFCLGVQWHPEHMARRTPLQRQLFQAFVEAAGQGHPG